MRSPDDPLVMAAVVPGFPVLTGSATESDPPGDPASPDPAGRGSAGHRRPDERVRRRRGDRSGMSVPHREPPGKRSMPASGAAGHRGDVSGRFGHGRSFQDGCESL